MALVSGACITVSILPVFSGRKSWLAMSQLWDPLIVWPLDERGLEIRRIARGLGISNLRRDVQEPS